MPTRRVQDLLVPKADLQVGSWIPIINECADILKPIVRDRRLTKLTSVPVIASVCTVGSLAKKSPTISIGQADTIEAIWGSWQTTDVTGDVRTLHTWGWTTNHDWLSITLAYRTCTDGHRVSYDLVSIEGSSTSLEQILKVHSPGPILYQLREQIDAFQEQNDKIGEKLQECAKRFDENYDLMEMAGIELKRNTAWHH